MDSVRVLIVDDHARVRTTLKMVLSLWDEFTIVGEASSGKEAVELARTLRPDVILMDLEMPGMDGAEATRILCEEHPDIRILILTGTVEFDRIEGALSAGARDYVLKTAPVDVIGTAIHQAAL